jgi:hypothetical protein
MLIIGFASSGLLGMAVVEADFAGFLEGTDFPFWAWALKVISETRSKELKALVFTVFLVSFFDEN